MFEITWPFNLSGEVFENVDVSTGRLAVHTLFLLYNKGVMAMISENIKLFIVKNIISKPVDKILMLITWVKVLSFFPFFYFSVSWSKMTVNFYRNKLTFWSVLGVVVCKQFQLVYLTFKLNRHGVQQHETYGVRKSVSRRLSVNQCASPKQNFV